MCRDNDHGGRRCPHDTARARRIRRHKAATISSYPTLTAPNPASIYRATMRVKPAPAVIPQAPASIAAITTLRADVAALERDYRQIREDPFAISAEHPYVLDGVAYNDSVLATTAIDDVMGVKILQAGEHVVALALQDQPLGEDAIKERFMSRLFDIDDELAALTRPVQDAVQIAAVRAELDTLTAEHNNDVAAAKNHPHDPNDSFQGFVTQTERITRMAALEEELNELRYTDRERASALKAELATLENYNDHLDPHDAQVLKAHADAYGNVLRQVREFGGVQQVHNSDNAAAAATLQQALQRYPTAWIEASNAADPMEVRDHPGRAHYAHLFDPNGNASDVVLSELNINMRDDSGFDPVGGYSIALHEYAHRVEWVGPKLIGRMEHHYLRRRATHDGVLEPLQKIIPELEEFAYFDQFPHPYMGRVYRGRPNREILSMGMETIFAGTHGGFMGVGGSRPDPETKRFILGLLATA